MAWKFLKIKQLKEKREALEDGLSLEVLPLTKDPKTATSALNKRIKELDALIEKMEYGRL